MFSAKLLDHFQNPRNAGDLADANATVEAQNPACGDLLRLTARICDGRVEDVRYQVRGCTASIAAGSALTELIAGRTRTEISSLGTADIEQALDGLPTASKHAAILCIDAIRALVKLSG